jgi:putative heme-binding domain-containing protein
MIPRRARVPFVLVAAMTAAWAGRGAAQGAAQGQDHAGQYSQADIVSGSRVYRQQCITCHGPTGNGVAGVDFRRGQFRHSSSDDDLRKAVLTGVPNTPMPPFKLNDAELNGIIAYIRAGLDVNSRAVRLGNPVRGRELFESKGECATCHRVRGAGPLGIAPDLGDVGAIRSAAALHATLVDPSAAMMPIHRPVRLVLKDGKTLLGRRLNEDTYTIQITDEQGVLRSVAKADVRQYEIATTSPMPPATGKLTAEEIADVLAYLVSLRG